MNKILMPDFELNLGGAREAAHVRQAIVELITQRQRSFAIASTGSLPDGTRVSNLVVAGPGIPIRFISTDDLNAVELNTSWVMAMVEFTIESGELQMWDEDRSAEVLESVAELRAEAEARKQASNGDN